MMKILIFAALTILSAFGPLAAAASADPIDCMLNSLSFTLPEIDIDLDGKELVISDLTCGGFDLTSLPSAYQAPTSLAIGATGLSASCSGNYAYGILHQNVAIALVTDIVLTVFVEKLNDYPIYSNFSTCNVTRFDVTIDFSSAILNAFAPLIAGMMEKAIYSTICVTLNSAYSTAVTKALATKINPKIAEISASTADPWPVYGKHYIDWSNSTYSHLRDVLGTLTTSTDIPAFLQCMANGAPKSLFTAFDGLGSLGDAESVRGSLGGGQSIWDEITTEVEALAYQPIEILPGLSLQILHASFRGLDTLSDMKVLEPLEDSKVVLRTAIAFASLSVDLRVKILLNTSEIVPGCQYYEEEVMLSLAVDGNSLIADLVLAADGHLLDSFKMDQLSSPACWASILDELSLPNVQFVMGLTDISLVQVRGDSEQLEADLTALLDNVLTFLFAPEAFQKTTEMLITGLAQGPLRAGLNKQLDERLTAYQTEHPCLSHYPYDDETAYITWASAKEVQMIADLVNNKIGVQGMNEIMSCATNGTGALTIQSRLFLIEFAGLNSFYGLELFGLDAEKPFNLQTYLALGYCPDESATPVGGAITFPAQVSSRASTECHPFSMSLTLNPATLMRSSPSKDSHMLGLSMPNRTMHVVLSVDNMALFMDTAMKVDKNKLKDLAYGQLSTSGCKASSVETMVFDALQVNVSRADVVFKDGALDKNITSAVQKLLAYLTRPDVLDSHNADIADSLYAAEPTCMNGGVNPLVVDPVAGDSSSSQGMDWKWQLFILCVAAVTCLAGLLMAYHHWGKVASAGCLLGDEEDEDELTDAEKAAKAAAALAARADASRPLWDRYAFSETLLFHKDIPLWIRVLIPCAIIGNIVLFIDSNIEPDAVSVMVAIEAKGTVYDLGPVFNFGLGGTIKDMWEAEVYTLAVLIAFFSGAWPYIKLSSMLVSWLTPPGLLSTSNRENILIVLDALGKWSLVDFFVMVLMLCAFYFNLPIIPGMAVDVTVQPKWGFYSFLLATMISLGLGHTIVACHRLVVDPKVPAMAAAGDVLGAKDSLVSLTYEVDLYVSPLDQAQAAQAQQQEEEAQGAQLQLLRGRGRASKQVVFVRTSPRGQLLIMFSILLTTAFIILGTMVLSMAFEFKGLVGLFLKDNAIVDYSFISVGQAIPEHSGIPNDFAIRWMQASYFIFGLLMPLGLMVSLTVLWFVPMPLDRMRQVFVLSEVLNAWATLDVYCIAIAASILEIRQFAAFIVGDACDGINVFLEKQFMDQKLDGDDLCFDVVAYLRGDAWMLFMAAGLILVVSVPSLMVGHAAVHMRLTHGRTVILENMRRARHQQMASCPAMMESFTAPLLQEQEEEEAASMDKAGSQQTTDERQSEESKLEEAEQTRGSSSMTKRSSMSKKARRQAERSEAFWKWTRWSHNKLQILYALSYCKLVTLDVRSISVDAAATEEVEEVVHEQRQEPEEQAPLLVDPSIA